jgi:hypothetical protein
VHQGNEFPIRGVVVLGAERNLMVRRGEGHRMIRLNPHGQVRPGRRPGAQPGGFDAKPQIVQCHIQAGVQSQVNPMPLSLPNQLERQPQVLEEVAQVKHGN